MHTWGRTCLYCGYLDQISDTLLCSDCGYYLRQDSWKGPPTYLRWPGIAPVEVYPLFQWIPNRNDVLSHLVFYQKGKLLKAWRHHLVSTHPKSQDYLQLLKPSTWFVPCPKTSQSWKKNHADGWVLALQDFCKESSSKGSQSNPLSLGPQLIIESNQSAQRGKGRGQRKQRRFSSPSHLEFLAYIQSQRVVFVDDVVTTGSTAQAVWKSLGKPQNFSVFCFCFRELNCGRGGPLPK